MIRDAEFAEQYAEDGIGAIYDNGIRGSDFARPGSELARFISAHDDLIEDFADFLDVLEEIVDKVLDGEA